MKLIIDIPESAYEFLSQTVDCIANGRPLEKHDEDIIKETVASVWGKPPCDDAISRQAVIDGIDIYIEKVQSTGAKDDFISFEELVIKQLPLVYPQPKTGHWILDETDNSITCNKCGCLMWANDLCHGDAHYCPNCGARMESEE